MDTLINSQIDHRLTIKDCVNRSVEQAIQDMERQKQRGLNILANLSFDIKIEVIAKFNFTQLVKLLDICPQYNTNEYFERLLKREQLPTTTFSQLDGSTVERYIIVLAQHHHIDEQSLPYVLKSRLFKGIEYYIGLSETGIRAIHEHNKELLLYIVSLYPQHNERLRILQELRLDHLQTNNYILSKEIQDKLEGLLNLPAYDWETTNGKYYPKTKGDYEEYMKGKLGEKLDKYNHAYVYGVIDGHQDAIFGQIHDKIYSKDLLYHAAAKGTPFMINLIKEYSPRKLYFNDGIDRLRAAISGNNLANVRFLLEVENVKEISRGIDLPSMEMVKLLEEFGHIQTLDKILSSAFVYRNYDMFNVICDKILISCIHGTGYMIETHFKSYLDETLNKFTTDTTEKRPQRSDRKRTMDVRTAKQRSVDIIILSPASNYDIYTVEILLKMGLRAHSGMTFKFNHEFTKIIELNLDMYPMLKQHATIELT